MTNINNRFKILPSEKEGSAITHTDATGKKTYVSPKLIRIGSTARDTSWIFMQPGNDSTSMGS